MCPSGRRRTAMGKTNWKRALLGGLVAGITINVIASIALAVYLRKLWNPALAALNPAFQETTGFKVFWIIHYLLIGILAVWLYSAIRPRFGAGPKTAVVAGLAMWILNGLSFSASMAAFGLLASNLLVTDSLIYLVALVVATLAGAWIYKEQSQ